MEPIIYDENEEGKVTKITEQDGSIVIEQYTVENKMQRVVLDSEEVKRLYSDLSVILNKK